jgi:hypothetical protein
VLATALALAAPVAAITTGQPDDNEHPYVGQLLFYVPDAVDSRFTDLGSWFNCTGTLLNSTVIVTAGHCTFGVGLNGASTTGEGAHATAPWGDGGTDIWIHFGEQANYVGLPPSSGYAPDNNDNAFFLYDAGVVVLDEEVTDRDYGTVAGLNYLEKYRSTARNEQRFEVVGYGLTKVLPIDVAGDDERLKAEPKLNSLNGNPRDTYIVLSNNKATGGTCFGDSGGPTFDNTTSNLVVAVTSFGISPNCTGTGGAYRLDQADDLAFLATYGIRP